MTLRDISRAVRTRQWAKNTLLLAGFVFAGRLRAPLDVALPEATRVLLGFICFCALSGATYLLNDWRDVESDRLHPLKKNRPLAAGRITVRQMFVLFAILVLIALICMFTIYRQEPKAVGFIFSALFYLLLTLSYSIYLKHEVIVDVLCLAAGFVIRVVAGCLTVPVEISPWIIFCTFTLALFIVLCKRRAELLEMGELSIKTRSVLPRYNVPLLDTFIAISACLTITAYSFYTFTASHARALGDFDRSPLMMTTIPFVVYGIFRYLLLAHSSAVGGEPEQMLRDKPLMINIVLWGILVISLTVLSKF